MRREHLAVVLCSTVVLALSCSKSTFTPTYQVHPDFDSQVKTFFKEASIRGVQIDSSNLIMDYDPTLDLTTCGECNSLADLDAVQKVVRISPEKICMDTEYEKEALIFHELGHCFLGRDHLTDTLPNGDPKSMMAFGKLTIYAPCKYVFGEGADCNNVHKREYYIDELFDPNTPMPEWAKR